MSIHGRRIVLGISGSIAAFKAAGLASELTQKGATVRTILTAGGARFITPEALLGLTRQPVSSSLWRTETKENFDHLELAHWAELLVIAPASANCLARIALGLTDDLLGAVALAFSGPMIVAPAMESNMWSHPATADHVAALTRRGVRIVGPESGRLASGAVGDGRMSEPIRIVEAIKDLLGSADDFEGCRFLVTAGPTQEPIDPVRFLSNRSSGKMGYAIANAAARRGANVVLVSGPVEASVSNTIEAGIDLIRVERAAEMKEAVNTHSDRADVIVMSAAVADFRASSIRDNKIKKTGSSSELVLEPTDDILAGLGQRKPTGQILVGFAAETEDVLAHAQEKLRSKRLDLIIANDVNGIEGSVFGSDENQVTLIWADGNARTLDRAAKIKIAESILDEIGLMRQSAGTG